MATKTRLLGYWISSTDEDSAREAVKMGGLPVLVMGANAALTSLLAFFQTPQNLAIVTWCAIIALLLIIIAFRIRAEKLAWVPFALVMFAVFLVVNAFFSYIVWKAAGGGLINAVQIMRGWIIPLICIFLALSGFKGWLWLKANGTKSTF